mmetsp:Transcript_14918/g.31861  ORF Transcript_14918/g.31861 Transcript_14918/m.31861 type:complete len:112 (+) Transcript_14918:905-1240(+)
MLKRANYSLFFNDQDENSHFMKSQISKIKSSMFYVRSLTPYRIRQKVIMKNSSGGHAPTSPNASSEPQISLVQRAGSIQVRRREFPLRKRTRWRPQSVHVGFAAAEFGRFG